MYLTSTVVAPSFETQKVQVVELTKEAFVDLLAEVDTNLCGHPVTSSVLKVAYPDLPEPKREFWQGDGKCLAARPKGGVRGASQTGDTKVTIDDLEFCMFWIDN